MSANGKACVALFNYVARDSEELSITKGDKLLVIDDKGTWWKVENQQTKKSGLVPSNYVKLSETQQAARTKFDDQPNQYQQPDLMIRNGPSLNITAIAKFRYLGTREDELSLEKGDEVIVMEKEADGWWRGRSGTKIGWFPYNYVEEVANQGVSTTSPVSQNQPPPPAQSKQKSVICSVVALYSFNSGNPEELAFEKGDLLDIIDQPVDDPDWWEARTPNGAMGLVPRNYVEVVHDVPAGGVKGVPAPANSGAAIAAAMARGPPPFAREVWFHGKIPRRDAENLLNQQAANGQFIVRESETKPGDYSISMKAPDRIKHFNVKNLSDGRLGIGQRKFDNMDDLIAHYKRAPIYTTNMDGKMYLSNGLPKR